MSSFHVRRDAEGLFIIEDKASKRWWTASPQPDGWHILTGDKLRLVQDGGRLGKSIVAAIENHKKMALVRAVLSA